MKKLKKFKNTKLKIKKTSPVQEQWDFSLSSSAVTSLASRPVSVFYAGLETSCGGWQVGGVPWSCWWKPVFEAI
jgi:ABC-type transporter MlaC component